MKKIPEKLPRGIRNNNPLNIRRTKTSSWMGMREEQTDKSFCQFTKMRYGWRAAFMLLKLYYAQHKLRTIRQIINRWAPSSDNNNTEAYIASVCKDCHLTSDQPLPYLTDDPQTWFDIVAAMVDVECGETAEYLDKDLILGFILAVKDEVK